MNPAPILKQGNRAIARAINAVAMYAQKHGVNPAGRPGWSQSEYGWVPPLFSSSALVGESMWDIVKVSGSSDEYELFAPKVRTGLADIEDTVTFNNTAFTPAADHWLVAKIDDLSTLEITTELLDDWEDHPNAYEFDSNDFEAARIPLWQFYGDDDDGLIEVSSDVYGEKLVPNRALTIYDTLVSTGAGEFKAVPFLL